jgi:hypothetical protein
MTSPVVTITCIPSQAVAHGPLPWVAADAGADVNAVRQANLGLGLGILAFVLWPFAYVWLIAPGRNPDWFAFLIPIAEWGGIACAFAAIWLGGNARRAGQKSRTATWAPQIGAAAIVL